MATTCSHINGTSARIPAANTPVHKEECTLCFDSWDNEEGLYVCLSCYNGGCAKHAKQHFHKRNAHALAVNIKRTKKPQPPQEQGTDKEPPAKITKLAIGVPGGLQVDSEDQYEYKTTPYCFACDKALPAEEGNLAAVIEGIMKANSASRQADNAAWEKKLIQCEHTVTLQQDPNAPKLGKKSLSHCNNCELSSNLWLCLTCGNLGCARANWDGSGGNAHAVAHNQATGHPLVLKVGTITPEGTADVHCYACDEERLDPMLTEHLAHLGINVATAEKTEKSLAELELEINLNMDWSTTQEGGLIMKNLYGPGLTGFRNLGNTCYMASILQVLFALPEFQQRYYSHQGGNDHRDGCGSTPSECFHCQITKLADGILSGRYSRPEERKEVLENKDGQPVAVIEDQEGVPPRMFKTLVCREHDEFKTNAQQDAYEFFQFLLKQIQQRERASGNDPSKVFDLKLQQRLQCLECKQVRYSSVSQTEVSLPIPMNMADPPVPNIENEKASDRYEREGKSTVPFAACINALTADEAIEFHCPNCNKNTAAVKNYRFENFPTTMMVHMRRFVFEDWVPRKLAVNVGVPDVIDLESARGLGKQANETALPDDSAQSQGPTFNEADIGQLMGMGFGRNRCERALQATGNSGADAAMEWIFAHMDDADIDDPLPKAAPAKKASGGAGAAAVDENAAQQLSEMGFTLPQARKALQETGGNMDRAVEWLFSHAGDMDTDDQSSSSSSSSLSAASSSSPSGPSDTRPAKYQLIGFIVHLGSSVHCGHYVAFVRKDGQWVQFNDRKVSESLNPPVGKAYMYFFRRLEQ